MESFDQGFWQAIGVEAWRYAPNPVEAVKAYLSVVPVVCRSHLPLLLQQEITTDTLAQLQRRGVTRIDRGLGTFERGKLLWSRDYLRAAKGEWTRLSQDPDHIYRRSGWDPVLGPLALYGLGLLHANPVVLLLGSDLIAWCKTFCHPDAKLPSAWCTQNLGTGAGMLLVPPETPERHEHWVFFMDPRCNLEQNIYDLVQEIHPVLSARLAFGRRVAIKFLLGYRSNFSPGHPNPDKRRKACIARARKYIFETVRFADPDRLFVETFAVMQLREIPALWRYYERNPRKKVWSLGIYPFSLNRNGEIKQARRGQTHT